jgi:hypothetical protein
MMHIVQTNSPSDEAVVKDKVQEKWKCNWRVGKCSQEQTYYC